MNQNYQMKSNEKKVFFYKDELNDEFSSAKITPRIIDENYKYEHSKLWNICSYIMQNVLSMPIKYLYAKIKFKIKFIGREKLKAYKKQGYFIYANHTQAFADTFIPSLACYPKRNFLIVNPENVSMKGLSHVVEMLGAIPIPNRIDGMKNFLEIIEKRSKIQNCSITIYPEAHIWPYYTKIRKFKSVSFKYPIKYDKPVFSLTNTYKSYGKNKVKIETYIDGPFFPKENMSLKENQEYLCKLVYENMVSRSQNSNIKVIEYEKV